MRLDVSEVVMHPEYRDPAYMLGKEGPKVFRSESTITLYSTITYSRLGIELKAMEENASIRF